MNEGALPEPGTLAVVHNDYQHARERSFNTFLDNLVLLASGVSALWLAWLVLSETLSVGWLVLPFFILFWLLLAYLVLPRVHRILTSIYVPDYFIGRARTSDGLLGDPINLALEGSEAQIHAAMTGAHWIRADEITLGSSWKIITSTVFRRSYDEAPVSPLLLFGRQQDLAYQQEVAGNPAKRHHVRFWRCPEGWLLPGGHKADWLAAGTFDRAVGFSLFTLQITHKIDANTDIERDHIVTTLTGGHPEVTVRTIVDFSTGYHSRNGGGDSIETDGDLPVVDVTRVSLIGAATLADDATERRAARARQRPVSTMLGVLLMGIRFVVGILATATIIADKDVIFADAVKALSLPDTLSMDLAINLVIAVTAIGSILYLVMAVFVYKGSNWARIVTMVLSLVLIGAQAADIILGSNITLRQDIFGLPLDILVLLALSSQRSSLWARRDSSPAAG